MRYIKKTVVIVFFIVLLLGIPKLSGMIADQFNYQSIDPDSAFMWISVHHIVQALIFLLIMIVLIPYLKRSDKDFGFHKGDVAIGLKYVKIFSLIFLSYAVISIFIVLITNAFNLFPYPINARNVIGQLSFQLLLSGPSEELIFRAFAITMFSLFISGRVLNGKFSKANLIAAVVFALAHVGFSFAPFELNYNVGQLVYSFILGMVYGDCYEKSKSMLYPMILHSISNVVAVSVSIIATLMIT